MKFALIAALAALSIAPLSAAVIGEYPLYEFRANGEFNDGSRLSNSMIADVLADVVLSTNFQLTESPLGDLSFDNLISQGPHPWGIQLVIHDSTATYGLVLILWNHYTLSDLQTSGLYREPSPDNSTRIFSVATGQTIVAFYGGNIERLNPGTPEPSTWALCIGALAGIVARSRRARVAK